MDTWAKPKKRQVFSSYNCFPLGLFCSVLRGRKKFKFHGFWKLLNPSVGEKQIFSREASWHKPFLFQCFKRKPLTVSDIKIFSLIDLVYFAGLVTLI